MLTYPLPDCNNYQYLATLILSISLATPQSISVQLSLFLTVLRYNLHTLKYKNLRSTTLINEYNYIILPAQEVPAYGTALERHINGNTVLLFYPALCV